MDSHAKVKRSVAVEHVPLVAVAHRQSRVEKGELAFRPCRRIAALQIPRNAGRCAISHSPDASEVAQRAHMPPAQRGAPSRSTVI